LWRRWSWESRWERLSPAELHWASLKAATPANRRHSVGSSLGRERSRGVNSTAKVRTKRRPEPGREVRDKRLAKAHRTAPPADRKQGNNRTARMTAQPFNGVIGKEQAAEGPVRLACLALSKASKARN
jgi:hypothetical protein